MSRKVSLFELFVMLFVTSDVLLVGVYRKPEKETLRRRDFDPAVEYLLVSETDDIRAARVVLPLKSDRKSEVSEGTGSETSGDDNPEIFGAEGGEEEEEPESA